MPYAVVFSGGGALGSWEVGCYEALLDAHGGEPPICVTGASAGALNAAAICAGMNTAQLRQLWMSLKPRDVFSVDVSFGSALWASTRCLTSLSLSPLLALAGSKRSVLSTAPLEKTLSRIFNGYESAFLGSNTWFAISLTNLTRKSKEMFYKVPAGAALPESFQHSYLPKEQPPVWVPITGYLLLRQALMGTTALPLLFPPFQNYFDGGVLLNQPISPAIQIMNSIVDPENNGNAPIDIFVLIPEPESLGNTDGLLSTATTVLSTWLSASLLSQISMVKLRNKIRKESGQGQIRLCAIRPSTDFSAGLLDFGKNVSELIDQGRHDCQSKLSLFDRNNPNTWY